MISTPMPRAKARSISLITTRGGLKYGVLMMICARAAASSEQMAWLSGLPRPMPNSGMTRKPSIAGLSGNG
ncbi:hypothetical protein D3C76_1536910 [compost metagenome]